MQPRLILIGALMMTLTAGTAMAAGANIQPRTGAFGKGPQFVGTPVKQQDKPAKTVKAKATVKSDTEKNVHAIADRARRSL